MAVYKTNANKELVKTAGNTGSGLPVGAIFPSAIPLTDARVHLLDGSTISQTGVYSDFANLIKTLVLNGYNISCSETEFNSDVSATGNCGKFVIDNTNGTIRLPKITTFIQGLSSITNIGDSLSAGLPNITDRIQTQGVDNQVHSILTSSTTGLFANDGSTSGIYTDYKTYSYSQGQKYIKFDASKANNIYGNSNTVQPQATQFPYYIVLASGYKSTEVVNFDNITTELNKSFNEITLLKDKTYKLLVDYTLTTNSSEISIEGLNLEAGDYIIELFGKNSSSTDLYLTFNGYTDSRYNQTGMYWSTTQTADLSSPSITTGVRMYKAGFYYASSMRPVEGRIIYKVTVSGNATPDNSNIFINWETDFCATGYQIYARCGGSTFLPENKITKVNLSGGTIIAGARLKIYKLSGDIN